jgi:hypothetical protein
MVTHQICAIEIRRPVAVPSPRTLRTAFACRQSQQEECSKAIHISKIGMIHFVNRIKNDKIAA